MQNQPNKISDFDLMTELDVCYKQSAAQLTTAVLEASNPQLRQHLANALQHCFQQQYQLAQLMMQKGYYKPLPANPQMIELAAQQIQMASAQVAGPGAPGLTAAVQPNIVAPATGTGAIPPQS